MSIGDKHTMMLKITEKKVPFRAEGEQEMYCLKTDGSHPLKFGEKVVETMKMQGVPKGMAKMVAAVMSETLVSLLSAGHAVNIEGLGTFRLEVNSKAHSSPAECSLADIKKRKLRFFPDKEMQKFLKNCSFRIDGQKRYVEEWKKRKKK